MEEVNENLIRGWEISLGILQNLMGILTCKLVKEKKKIIDIISDEY
jgi:hypothetical protein